MHTGENRFNALYSMASLIAASWNPLMDRLKALSSLRDLTQTVHVLGSRVVKKS